MTEKTFVLTGISALILLIFAQTLLEIQVITIIFEFPPKVNQTIKYFKAIASLVLFFLGIFGCIVKLRENKKIKNYAIFLFLGSLFSSVTFLIPISNIYFLKSINIDVFNLEEKTYFQGIINNQINFLIFGVLVFVLLLLCLSVACKRYFNNKAT